MSSTREQVQPRQKRRRTEEDPLLDEPSELQTPKRLKSSFVLHSAAFYDSLSKVPLTRRSLKELDRRISQVNSPQPPISIPRRVYRKESLKQLRRFARHGGPELRDLRAYPSPTDNDSFRTMSSNQSSQSRRTQSTRPTSIATPSSRRSSTYDGAFELHLIGNGIFPKGYDYPAGRELPELGNLEDIQRRLAQRRPSLSPSRFTTSDFRAFERVNDRVISEGKVMRTVFPIISSNADIPNEGDLLFTRLESMTNGVTVNAKPDFYDGAYLKDIDQRIREDLGSYIIPSTHQHAPVAPNFFTEAKPPKAGADVAKLQACYNGALGARAMHKLQSYGEDEPVFDNNAYTLSATYHAGNLNMYATHVTLSRSGGLPEYHMSQVGGWNTIGDPDTCRRGLTAFRNGRDWARDQRNGFISTANERAISMNAEQPPGLSYSTDVEGANPLTDEQDPEDEPQYFMSQQAVQGGYMNNEPSTCESSDHDDFSDTTEMPCIEKSETSADELSFETYEPPTASKKRRNKASQKTVSKAPRHNDGKPGERHHSKG